MAAPTFTWCDLSTFRPSITKPFYSRLFGWQFDGASDYDYASIGGAEVAAVFQMPDKLREIGMPSFWMSYVSVPDVAAAVGVARGSGGRIELERSDHALIRDPLGAGFTVYQGPRSGTQAGSGGRAGHAYMCADIAAVAPFYKALFGWEFEAMDGSVWQVRSQDGEQICFAYQLPDAVRGKEQYWAVLFNVANLASATETALSAGATHHVSTELQEGPVSLIHDPDGAAFFLIETA